MWTATSGDAASISRCFAATRGAEHACVSCSSSGYGHDPRAYWAVAGINELEIRRLKKRKLKVKDTIILLQLQLEPDAR
jgi:hypothetical protein